MTVGLSCSRKPAYFLITQRACNKTPSTLLNNANFMKSTPWELTCHEPSSSPRPPAVHFHRDPSTLRDALGLWPLSVMYRNSCLNSSTKPDWKEGKRKATQPIDSRTIFFPNQWASTPSLNQHTSQLKKKKKLNGINSAGNYFYTV